MDSDIFVDFYSMMHLSRRSFLGLPSLRGSRYLVSPLLKAIDLFLLGATWRWFSSARIFFSFLLNLIETESYIFSCVCRNLAPNFLVHPSSASLQIYHANSFHKVWFRGTSSIAIFLDHSIEMMMKKRKKMMIFLFFFFLIFSALSQNRMNVICVCVSFFSYLSYLSSSPFYPS